MTWIDVVNALRESYPTIFPFVVGALVVFALCIAVGSYRKYKQNSRERRQREVGINDARECIASARQTMSEEVTVLTLRSEAHKNLEEMTGGGKEEKWNDLRLVIDRQRNEKENRERLEKIFWQLKNGEFTYAELGTTVQEFKDLLVWYQDSYPN